MDRHGALTVMWAAITVSAIGVEVTFESTRDAAVWIAAVGAGATVVWRLVRPVIRWGRRLEHVMTSVEDQLYPNGGATLRDAVIEIQKKLDIEPRAPKKPERKP